MTEGNLPNAVQGAQGAAPGATSGLYPGAVFISYASQDVEAAVRICDALRSAGVEVWFDQSELRGGDAWDQTIRARIRDCTLFIPIISRHTQERLEGYFRREWKLAVNRTHDMAQERAFLVPVVVDDTQPQEARVPEQFRGLQWTVIVDGNVPPSFVGRVSDLLSAKGDTTGTTASRLRAGEGPGATKAAPAPAAVSAGHSLPTPPPAAGHSAGHFPFAVPFLDSIKRRNVGRVAILYVVASYILLEGFELFYHLLELPAWAGRLAVGLAALGLPIVTAVAWAYDSTPEGLTASDHVDPTRSQARHTGRRLNRAIVVVLFIALAYFAADKFWLSQRATSLPEHAATAALPTTTAPTSNISQAVQEKSVAVLPFVDMSEKHDQEFLSDGLTEELINSLSRLQALKIISRTSSFYFKGRNEDIRKIASELGVANVLEGSVQRVGSQVRITVKLIDGHDGSQRWSRAYDSRFSDLFVLEDKLAASVANQMQVELLSAVPLANGSEVDAESHSLVLQGNFSWRLGNKAGRANAIALYKRAIASSPSYDIAYASLAYVYILQGVYLDIPAAEARAQAASVNDQAIELNPSSSFAHRNAGIISHRFDRDWTRARIEFERGVQLDPNGYQGRASQADLAMVDESLTGSVDRSISVLRKFLLDDPINNNILINLAYDLQSAGRYSESIDTWRRLLSYYPNTDEARSELVKTLILAGDVAQAGQEAGRETSKEQQCLETAFVEAARLHHTLAERALSCATGDVRAYQVADFYAYIGDEQSAFYWLKQAWSMQDPGLDSLPTDPFFRRLRDDDRYREILKMLRIAA